MKQISLGRAAPAGPGIMRARVVTAAALLALLLLVVWAGIVGASALVAVACGLGLWEFEGLSRRIGTHAAPWVLYPAGLFLVFSGTYLKAVPVEWMLAAAAVVGLTAALFVPKASGGLPGWGMALAGAIYLGVPGNYFLLLFAHAAPSGAVWVLFTVLAVVVNDSVAMLVGARLGRLPFFNSISPKKTLEGALAGIAGAVLTMLFAGLVFLRVGPAEAVGLGLAIGVSAVAGDLVESQLKRLAQVKDSSQLIPGHGGVLDRIDSLLFAPIVVYFVLLVFGAVR